MINVLIADDHAILRQGLKQIIAETDDMTVVAEAENGNKAIEMVRRHPLHVVLLDIMMPEKNGIDALKQIKQEYPQIAVLMLSMQSEINYAMRALKAGASGYLTKQSAPAQLVTAIRQVASGRKYISTALAEELANSFNLDSRKPHDALSDREYQTLCLIASGKKLSEIAEELSLSAKTVSVYRARMLEKLQLKNNVELTHYAMKNNLLD